MLNQQRPIDLAFTDLGARQVEHMLEVMVQANIGKLPQFSEMIVIEIPCSLAVERVIPSSLPGWNHRNNLASRLYGDDWIDSQRSVALIVPSVVAPQDRNIVINQLHPDFSQIMASPNEPIHWDQRLSCVIRPPV